MSQIYLQYRRISFHFQESSIFAALYILNMMFTLQLRRNIVEKNSISLQTKTLSLQKTKH